MVTDEVPAPESEPPLLWSSTATPQARFRADGRPDSPNLNLEHRDTDAAPPFGSFSTSHSVHVRALDSTCSSTILCRNSSALPNEGVVDRVSSTVESVNRISSAWQAHEGARFSIAPARDSLAPGKATCEVSDSQCETLGQLRCQLIVYLERQQQDYLSKIDKSIGLQNEALLRLGTLLDKTATPTASVKAAAPINDKRKTLSNLKEALQGRQPAPQGGIQPRLGQSRTQILSRQKTGHDGIPGSIEDETTVAVQALSTCSSSRLALPADKSMTQETTITTIGVVPSTQSLQERLEEVVQKVRTTKLHDAQEKNGVDSRIIGLNRLRSAKKSYFIQQQLVKSRAGIRRDSDGKQLQFFNMYSEKEPGMMQQIVTHSLFDVMSALLIIGSTISVGFETQHMATHEGESNDIFLFCRIVFYAMFCTELLMRILASGPTFFIDKSDRAWNFFDASMVLLATIELLLSELFGNMASMARGLRFMRVVRITRAMRIGRILRYSHTFRQILYSLKSSMATLFWALVIIFLAIYLFGVFFTQTVTDHLYANGIVSENEPAYFKDLRNYYGTVPLALLHLFQAMTGGEDWRQLMEPLLEINVLFGCAFLLFICVTYFGVTNIVAAVFVESALDSAQQYKDLLIQENVMHKQKYTQHLREVFQFIDKDNSGFICADEMEFFLGDASLNLYLESIDVYPNDARALFRLLDRDGSGRVSIEEFCEGCMRLKGEAKSFDIHCMIYNNERMNHKLELLLEWIILQEDEKVFAHEGTK